MAFLGSIGKAIGSVVQNPIFEAVFPVAAIANVAAEAAGSHLTQGLGQPSASSSHAVPVTNSYYSSSNVPASQSFYPQYQVVPGGSFLQQDTYPGSNVQSYGGLPSWAYSTPSPVYSIPQPTMYQASPTSDNRSWEDLTAAAGLLLL